VSLRDGILICLSFLSGSIPFGLLIARAKGINIRVVGSGNIGATNVGRALGRNYFLLCLSLDALKGLVPVVLAGWLLGGLGDWTPAPAASRIWLACAAAAVLGHVFCPWLGFRGGKGVATSLGALLGVFPLMSAAVLGAALVFAATLRISRYMSAASIAAAVGLPLCVIGVQASVLIFHARRAGLPLSARWLTEALVRDGLPFILVAAGLGMVVVWAHRANVRRLRAGTEPRFAAKRPPSEAASSTPVRDPQHLTKG